MWKVKATVFALLVIGGMVAALRMYMAWPWSQIVYLPLAALLFIAVSIGVYVMAHKEEDA